MNVRTEKKSLKTVGTIGTCDTKLKNDVASVANADKKQTIIFIEYEYRI
jgi:hypothetical protein